MRRRRAASIAIVLACAALALAATAPGGITASPEVAVVALAAAMPGSGSDTLANPGTSSVTVSAFAQSPCDDAGMVIASPATPFSIAAGGMKPVAFDCPATAAFGLRRCTFHAQDLAMTDLASFMGVCATAAAATLSADQTSLSFTNVPIGTTQTQTITITNTGANTVGTLQLQTTDLDGVVLVGAPCSTNANGCDVTNAAVDHFTVDVLCHPSSTTTVTRALYIIDSLGDTLASPISVTCSGSATTAGTIGVTTTPSPLDVGRVEVLGGSGSGNVRISNVGTTGTLTVTAIAISGAGTDWTYTIGAPCNGTLPCMLGPGVFVDVAVKLTPSAIGPRNATMSISSNDPAASQVNVQLAGTGQGATLQLAPGDPTTIDMGDVPKNGTASVAIHLANSGNRNLTDVSLSLAGASELSTTPASPTSSFTVTYGATPTTVMLTCTPGGSTGAFSTTFTASAPDTLNNTPVVVTATCHGTDSVLVASPPTLQLGEVRTGTTPSPAIVALENAGASSLTLAQQPMLSPAVSGLSLQPLASLVIAGNGSAALGVAVDPQMDGSLATAIQAADTSGNNTVSVPVTGKIVTATVMAPPSVALGTFCVNQPTTATTIALHSTGTATITLDEPMMATPGSPFQLAPRSPPTYPATLAPSGLATVDVLPRRQSTAGALAPDDIVWSTDIAGDPHPRTTVSAQFLAAGAAIAPASLSFGQVPIHLYIKDAQPVTIENCSGPTITLTPSVDPPFSIDGDFPTTLAAAEIATFAVGFHPTKAGAVMKTLRITTSDQQVLEVTLTGEGASGVPPDDAGTGSAGFRQTSFYACSCTSSGPGGVLPVAIALVCVLFPRRRRARA
ncbi:MAG: choice-of-anchor D domain-containing protein [Acidobacteriota bacterium]